MDQLQNVNYVFTDEVIFFENPLPVLVLLKLEISPNCIPRHRELGPSSDKIGQIYTTTQNHDYQNTDNMIAKLKNS